MDISSELGFFVLLAKLGSLSAAAREMGMTPPAATKRLRQMEQRLGVRLVNRSTRRITVIRVVPTTGYYWDNKHGHAVAGVKMLIGAAIGKTMDDSIEGKLKV